MPPRSNLGLGLRRVRLVSGLLHQVVELDLRLRPFQSARVPHDLLVGVAVAIGLDRGFALPFRVLDEFGGVSAAQELFRKAALLLGGIYRDKRSGAGRAKGGGQGECAPAKHALDSEPGSRVTGVGAYAASNCRHTPEVGEVMGRAAEEVVARQTAIDTQGHRGGYRDNWNSVVGFQLWANKTTRFGGTSRDPKPERPHY